MLKFLRNRESMIFAKKNLKQIPILKINRNKLQPPAKRTTGKKHHQQNKQKFPQQIQTSLIKSQLKLQMQSGSSFPVVHKAIFKGSISTLLRKEFPIVATRFVYKY